MPQSTRSMSPWHSYSVMFLPTSPRPPKGMIFTGTAPSLHRAPACAAGHSRAACACPRQIAPQRPQPHLHLQPGHCLSFEALACFPRGAAVRRAGPAGSGAGGAEAACARGMRPYLRVRFSVFHSCFSSIFRTLRAGRTPFLCPAGTQRRPENVFTKENTLWPRMTSLGRVSGSGPPCGRVLQIDVLPCILSLKFFSFPAGRRRFGRTPEALPPLTAENKNKRPSGMRAGTPAVFPPGPPQGFSEQTTWLKHTLFWLCCQVLRPCFGSIG